MTRRTLAPPRGRTRIRRSTPSSFPSSGNCLGSRRCLTSRRCRTWRTADLDDLLAATPSPLTDEAGAAQADTEPSQNPTSPGDVTVRAQAPIAWSQTGDASTEDLWADTPLPMYGLMPDEASVEEAAFSSNDTASPHVRRGLVSGAPRGDETSTALHAPGPESSRTRVDTTAVTRKPSVVMIALAGVAALSVGIILLAPGLFGSSSVPSSKPSANATAATSTQVREHAANRRPANPDTAGAPRTRARCRLSGRRAWPPRGRSIYR